MFDSLKKCIFISRDFLVKGLCKDTKYNCLSLNVLNIFVWFFCCDFSLSCVQMGAGGFGVSLPCRSRSGRLFVSRQPDQGRWPGLQQRGQLHVSANPLNHQVTDCQVTIRSDHCTSTRHKAHRQWRRDFAPPATLVLSALSEHQPGTLYGCSACTQWLRNIREVLLTWSAHLTNLKSSLTRSRLVLDSCWCYLQSVM